ncbi:MAG: FAD-binding protein [Nitrospinae bacterium]|nr:FAD-binding protein [Nitrospinota bacterium]
MTINEHALSELRRGCINLTTDKAELLLYSFDATKIKHLPECVCFPESTAEVIEIAKACSKHKIPITPRGAGTGFTGAAVPIQGGVVIAFARMNRILKLDAEAMYVEVEPGIVNFELGKELARHGLFYPPDPASLKSSTIGGNVMTGAGGPGAVKYGVTRDYVMGLTVVLADGSVIETGIKTAKGAVGYDLTSLMVGSEGTLGIVTKIRLKVLPLPPSVVTALAVFDARTAAVDAVTRILRERLLPRTLEYIDRTAIRCVEEYLKIGLPVDAGGMLLIETDGDETPARDEMQKIHGICRELDARGFTIAQNADEAQSFWKIRRSISAAINRISPTKLNEDITVPRTRIAELMDRLDALSQRAGLPIVNFGHAGDGNIHVNVMTDAANAEEYARALKAVEEVFDITLELDGTLSGEHGVGLAKMPYIRKELGEAEVAISKRLKLAFDPDNILNPGKIFP